MRPFWSSTLGAVWLTLGMLSSVACQPPQGGVAPPTVLVVPAEGAEPLRDAAPVAAAARWFSGIIVMTYRLQLPKGSPSAPYLEQTTFISAPNFRSRETDLDGDVVYDVVYDPDRNLYLQTVPTFAVIDAGQRDDVRFELGPRHRTILGHPCRELVRYSPTDTARVWISDAFRVDPAAYSRLDWGGFHEQLVTTEGALELGGEIELEDRLIEFVATRVEPAVLGEDVWGLAAARALLAAPGD